MHYNRIEPEQDMWTSRFETFEGLKEKLMSVEDEIREKVGDNLDPMKASNIFRQKQELASLLYQRKHLLNWMLQGDAEEMERLKMVNLCMFNLTERLRTKLASVCQSLAVSPKDSFTDDCEVRARLAYIYDDDKSVLSLSSDCRYGSDYQSMMSIICEMENTNISGGKGLELHARYDKLEESLLANMQDDGDSWAHEMPAHLDYDEICVCYALCAFCRDSLFSVFDVLHMNAFWSTVNVEYQNFSTLM